MTTTAPQYLIKYDPLGNEVGTEDTADTLPEAIRKAQVALAKDSGEAVIYQATRVVASKLAVDVSEYRAPVTVEEAACVSGQ